MSDESAGLTPHARVVLALAALGLREHFERRKLRGVLTFTYLLVPCNFSPIRCLAGLAGWWRGGVISYRGRVRSQSCNLGRQTAARGVAQATMSAQADGGGTSQASQARLSREGACDTAAQGEHVQERLQGRFLRMQGPLVVDLSLKRQP